MSVPFFKGPPVYVPELPGTKRCPHKNCGRRYMQPKIVKGQKVCPHCGQVVSG